MLRRFSPLLILGIGCAPVGRVDRQAETRGEITVNDVRSRIYRVSHDSMQGREVGELGNLKMTTYLAGELARMGVEPAGDNGTYYQNVPVVRRRPDSTSTLIAGNQTLAVFADFVPLRPTSSMRGGTQLNSSQLATIYGGRAGDTTVVLNAESVAGKIVVLDTPLGADGRPTATYATPTGLALSQFPGAAAVAVAGLDVVSPAGRASIRGVGNGLSVYADAPPLALLITRDAAQKLMGAPLESLLPGTAGRTAGARIGFVDESIQVPARNVVGILRGSDPLLRGQLVAVGAHSDHIGVDMRAVDHDSLRAFNRVMRPEGRQTPLRAATAAERARIGAILDSLRALSPPRRDSINNGADDDGSGSVAALEIAQSIASGTRPRRSILFVWHTGEEGGLLGSSWFVDNPTVSRDSIIAQLNMDMVGRGPDSLRGQAKPRTIQIIGSRRLSTELGDVVEAVNGSRTAPFLIDYSYDAPRHPYNRYCRSDHYNYARRGIPIAYFSRGYHEAYHMVTDEAQYLDFEGLAAVASLVRDVAVALANRDQRIVVDKPRMNSRAPCLQ